MIALPQLLTEHPTLNIRGYTFAREAADEGGREAERQALLRSVDEFDVCVAWLLEQRPHWTTHAVAAGSYRLKHVIEGEVGHYIPNGAMVAAGLALKPDGLKVATARSLNIRIGINLKWLDKMYRSGN